MPPLQTDFIEPKRRETSPRPTRGLVGTFFERPGNDRVFAPYRRIDSVKNSFVGTGVPDGPETIRFSLRIGVSMRFEFLPVGVDVLDDPRSNKFCFLYGYQS